MADIKVNVLGQAGLSMGGTYVSFRSRISPLSIDCHLVHVRNKWLAIGSICRGAGR